jgi:hypothetical protein
MYLAASSEHTGEDRDVPDNSCVITFFKLDTRLIPVFVSENDGSSTALDMFALQLPYLRSILSLCLFHPSHISGPHPGPTRAISNS